MSIRAVFLDRDGVINRAVVRDGRPYPPASMNEMEILEGVQTALAYLKKKVFYSLLSPTNQMLPVELKLEKWLNFYINSWLKNFPWMGFSPAITTINQFRVPAENRFPACFCKPQNNTTWIYHLAI